MPLHGMEEGRRTLLSPLSPSSSSPSSTVDVGEDDNDARGWDEADDDTDGTKSLTPTGSSPSSHGHGPDEECCWNRRLTRCLDVGDGSCPRFLPEPYALEFSFKILQ
ncbi:hypothetical protein AOL_s00215g811 [Orbilia oligospora ATCC 24927]|uniref:Uncharacterized protein n=1 Tax=Arthrobotrys oligospora (strain ATCC 24927 / CBS 115.81 / DSM 1491) TaxID=756982 RepID=G1XV03_ARTOA|nr:hypothetical protein AOL_s00215g811 [Orbilia oligospora ATCC 24927]EGX43025.1 hypothetical protein AOL_s00215g811 [Orbilia oligospora ATCC 24927]